MIHLLKSQQPLSLKVKQLVNWRNLESQTFFRHRNFSFSPCGNSLIKIFTLFCCFIFTPSCFSLRILVSKGFLFLLSGGRAYFKCNNEILYVRQFLLISFLQRLLYYHYFKSQNSEMLGWTTRKSFRHFQDAKAYPASRSITCLATIFCLQSA